MKQKTKSKPDPVVRATLRLPSSAWDAIRHRAVDEHTTPSKLVAKVMLAYLKGGRP